MSCMSSALKRQTKKREQYEVHIPPHPVRRRTRFTCLRFSKGHTWLNCLKAAESRKHHLEWYHTNWTILGQTVNPEKCVTTYKRESDQHVSIIKKFKDKKDQHVNCIQPPHSDNKHGPWDHELSIDFILAERTKLGLNVIPSGWNRITELKMNGVQETQQLVPIP